MEIKCSSCDKSINIPDGKVPKDKTFSITCPGCKNKIKVDQHLSLPTATEEDTIDATAIAESPAFFQDDDEEPVFYDENDKVALVLDDQNKKDWISALESLEYKIEFAKSPEHAVHKIKFTQFHLIALNENFGNVPLGKSAIYKSLSEMPMSTRRKMFAALVGGKFKTTNNMQALAASVNVVINQKDMAKLPRILKQAIAGNDLFYKNFKEVLVALGKV